MTKVARFDALLQVRVTLELLEELRTSIPRQARSAFVRDALEAALKSRKTRREARRP